MTSFSTEILSDRHVLRVESDVRHGEPGGVSLTLTGPLGGYQGSVWLPGETAVRTAAAITEARRAGDDDPAPAVSLYRPAQIRTGQRIIFDGKLYEITAVDLVDSDPDRPWWLIGTANERRGPRRMTFKNSDWIAATEWRQ